MYSTRISVLCATKRKGAVKFLAEQLNKQTFKDFEVVVADDGDNDILFDKQIVPRKKNPGDVWNLNKAYNDCLWLAKGELLVFLQDFIWIPANALQKFWDVYQYHPNDLISGFGHKALKGIEGVSEPDYRFGDKSFEEIHWSQYELNWASCPSKVAPKFDEEMDKTFGGENQLFAYKAFLQGSKIYIDRTNKCIGYSQEECGGRPKDWERKHINKTKLLETKCLTLLSQNKIQ